jgi:hypothetical protein
MFRAHWSGLLEGFSSPETNLTTVLLLCNDDQKEQQQRVRTRFMTAKGRYSVAELLVDSTSARTLRGAV